VTLAAIWLLESDNMERFDGLYALVSAMWADHPLITHAWIRLCVSTGLPKAEFSLAYEEIRRINSLCGRRVLVAPAWVDSHDLEVGETQHSVDPDSGIYRVNLLYSKKNVPAASCLLLVVQSSESEQNEIRSEGLLTLDGLESVLRMALGKNALIYSPYTQHVRLRDGQTNISTEVQTFDHTEGPRTEGMLANSALEIARATDALATTKKRRLLLALHLANSADVTSRLLSFWTAYEILAGGRGLRVYPFLATALERSALVAKRSLSNCWSHTLTTHDVNRPTTEQVYVCLRKHSDIYQLSCTILFEDFWI
jgi:hypothetical protein